MEQDTRSRVSLNKPGRESQYPVKQTKTEESEFVGRCITPVHICEEYIPRCITPEHIAEEEIYSVSDSSSIREIIPVHITEEQSIEKHTAQELAMLIETKSESTKDVEYTRDTAVMLISILDARLFTKAFPPNAKNAHIGTDNHIYCSVREGREIINSRSKSLDFFQLFMETLCLPKTDFMNIYDMVKQGMQDKGVFAEWFRNLFTFLELVYHDDIKPIVDIVSFGDTASSLRATLSHLTDFRDITTKRADGLILSAFIFKQLGVILRREPYFHIHNLFYFVCDNMSVEKASIDKKITLSESELCGLTMEQYQLGYHRSNLEACGRALTVRAPRELPRIINMLANTETSAAVVALSSLGIFTLVGFIGYIAYEEFALAESFLSTCFCTSLTGVTSSSIYLALAKWASKLCDKRVNKRALKFKQLGLAHMSQSKQIESGAHDNILLLEPVKKYDMEGFYASRAHRD